MLPTPASVLEVYSGDSGILSAPGGVAAPLLIDCSTVDPGTARQVAAAAATAPLRADVEPLPAVGRGRERDRGHAPPSPAVVDAPVSGGVPGAAAGTLTFMVCVCPVGRGKRESEVTWPTSFNPKP